MKVKMKIKSVSLTRVQSIGHGQLFSNRMPVEDSLYFCTSQRCPPSSEILVKFNLLLTGFLKIVVTFPALFSCTGWIRIRDSLTVSIAITSAILFPDQRGMRCSVAFYLCDFSSDF